MDRSPLVYVLVYCIVLSPSVTVIGVVYTQFVTFEPFAHANSYAVWLKFCEYHDQRSAKVPCHSSGRRESLQRK